MNKSTEGHIDLVIEILSSKKNHLETLMSFFTKPNIAEHCYFLL